MKTIDYNLIPKTFVHCCNSGCTRAADCLRQVAFRSLKDAGRREISVLNPCRVQGENCTEYLTSEPQLYKRGLSHLYDDMTVKTARSVRDTLYGHFGNTQYYRIINGERAVAPHEQAYIGRVLLKHGISHPEAVFDEEELRLVV